MSGKSFFVRPVLISAAAALLLLAWPHEPPAPPDSRSAVEDRPTGPDTAERAPEFRRFFRVIVTESGRLRADSTAIRLVGISGPERGRTCRHASGETWPCGVRAAAALSSLIRMRAVDCEIRDRIGDEVLGVCRVGNTDLSAWLLRHGWAEASEQAGQGYIDALGSARRERVGLWTEKPPQNSPGAPVTGDDLRSASSANGFDRSSPSRPARTIMLRTGQERERRTWMVPEHSYSPPKQSDAV